MGIFAKGRWFRFSLRTLFVAVTVSGCLLGWNLHRVRQRDAMLDVIAARKGSINSGPTSERRRFMIYGTNWTVLQTGQGLPFAWRLAGARPVRFIDIHKQEFSPDEVAQIQRLFPESDIAVWYFTFEGLSEWPAK